MAGTIIIIYLAIGMLISIFTTACVIERRKKRTNSYKTRELRDLYFWSIVAAVTIVDAIYWPFIVIEAVTDKIHN